MSDQTLPKVESNGEPKQPHKPPTFEDSAGNVWQIKLTVGLADEVLETTQVDLIPDDNDVSPIVALALQSRKFSQLLWLCVRSQAESKGVQEKEFRAAFEAQSLQDGWLALRDAILFFIRTTKGTMQADAAAGLFDAAMRMADVGAMALLEQVRSPKTEAAVKEMFQEAGKTAQADLKRNLSKAMAGDLVVSATSSPA